MKRVIAILVVSILIMIGGGYAIFYYTYKSGCVTESRMLYVTDKMTLAVLESELSQSIGEKGASRVIDLINIKGIDITKRTGAYMINVGDSPADIVGRLQRREQTPIKFTFNNVRTKGELADIIGERLMMSGEDILVVLNNDSICAAYGCDTATIVTLFMPDTYELYWNVSPERLLTIMGNYYNNWWSDERKAKANALGLTPAEVATLASIVEQESNKRDERPMVARLYLNRLNRGIKLQADPTVKYALNDFGLKRILNKHLKYDSPYNTYLYAGLPPAPIYLADKRTLDAVLNAPKHNYIYMCAKEDMSGYHNFTSSYSQHLNNAKRYQRELNRRGY
ncbi:MAG: endolytic transglycosylase MltG [Bacteroidales bacterium]